MSATPSPQEPLTGGCPCGAVRFEVRAPFVTALYCHCQRCQRRTGAAASANAQVDTAAFAVLSGADEIRAWKPEDGAAKAFCVRCGGHLYSGDPAVDRVLRVRLGALDADPGIRPSARQWVSSAASWEPIPDDGLPRFAGPRQS